jgi:hypothetical protein
MSSSDDPPKYDAAAYAVDRARTNAASGEMVAAARRATDAIDAVHTAPYPHLAERLHRQATDVVLAAKPAERDVDRIERRLSEMQTTVGEMQRLALRDVCMLPEGSGGETGGGADPDDG